MRIVFNKLTRMCRTKFQEIDWGKFVFYFSVSGIGSFFIILLTDIHVSSLISLQALSETNEVSVHSLPIRIASVMLALSFLAVYLYSILTMEKEKSWYRKSKKLFILYPLVVIFLIQSILNQSDTDSWMWWGIGFLVWLTCYMVTETIMEIFDKKIMSSWKEISAKDKYSLLIPVITFILGYILSN